LLFVAWDSVETQLQRAGDAPVFESSKRIKAHLARGGRPKMGQIFHLSNLCTGDFWVAFFAA
jgi:hypothetical protein